MKRVIFAGLVVFLALTTQAYATALSFFGEDLYSSAYLNPAGTNSEAAEAEFLSNLAGVETEDFESISGNTADFGAAGLATITGGSKYDGYGLGHSSSWLSNGAPVNILFSTAISAFGFYGIDMNECSSLVIEYQSGTTQTISMPGTRALSPDFKLTYFGFIDTDNPFTSVTMNMVPATEAYFWDNWTIGTTQQLAGAPGANLPGANAPVPEPGTIILLGFGLIGLAGIRRKIKK